MKILNLALICGLGLVLAGCQAAMAPAPVDSTTPIVKEKSANVPFTKGPSAPPAVNGPSNPPPGALANANSSPQAVSKKENILLTLPPAK